MNETSEVRADTASSDASRGTPSAAEISVGTDAAYAPAAFVHTQRPLRNISEVRHFFRTNEVPIYFVGATPFNLLGMDRRVRNFSYVTYYDGWDGAHPRVFSPRHKPYIEFESGEEINNWLLINPEVRVHMSRPAPRGQRPKVAMCSSTPRPNRSARSSATTSSSRRQSSVSIWTPSLSPPG
jgi:hypothetical protein